MPRDADCKDKAMTNILYTSKNSKDPEQHCLKEERQKQFLSLGIYKAIITGRALLRFISCCLAL